MPRKVFERIGEARDEGENAEMQEMRVLEAPRALSRTCATQAVLSARLLARARYKALRQTEVKEEVERREKAKLSRRAGASSGFFSRFWGNESEEAKDLLSNEEKKSLLNDLQDVNKATGHKPSLVYECRWRRWMCPSSSASSSS